jgi:hypothetical protein
MACCSAMATHDHSAMRSESDAGESRSLPLGLQFVAQPLVKRVSKFQASSVFPPGFWTIALLAVATAAAAHPLLRSAWPLPRSTNP